MIKLISSFNWLDIHQKTIIFAVVSLILNFIYAFYNGALGILTRSSWFVALCVYYLLLSLMRFFVVISKKKDYLIMKPIGFLLTALSLVLSVIIYVNLSQNIVSKYSTVTMIAIATFTFTKLSVCIKNAIQHKKGNTVILKVTRNIRYCEVAVSIFTMQRSMIVSFGDMPQRDEYFLNIMTGTLVFIFTLVMGISLITKARSVKL